MKRKCNNCPGTFPLTDKYWYRASYQPKDRITFRKTCKGCESLRSGVRQRAKESRKIVEKAVMGKKNPSLEEIKKWKKEIFQARLKAMRD